MKNSIILLFVLLGFTIPNYSQDISAQSDSAFLFLASNNLSGNSEHIMFTPSVKPEITEEMSLLMLKPESYNEFKNSIKLYNKDMDKSLIAKQPFLFTAISYDFNKERISLAAKQNVETSMMNTESLRYSIDAFSRLNRISNISFTVFTINL